MDVSQYLEIFIDESSEHIQTLSDCIMTLEQEPDNKDTIKRNLLATSERRLTGSIDFLGDITSEKPKTEKKKSTRDMLFM